MISRGVSYDFLEPLLMVDVFILLHKFDSAKPPASCASTSTKLFSCASHTCWL